MTGATLACGFALGWIAYHLLVSWSAMFRKCCREHYETHATCSCTDCAAERLARGEEA